MHYGRAGGLLRGPHAPILHAGGRGSSSSTECTRWLRWATPLVVASLLSSYLTFLVLSSIHAGQHSFHANAAGAHHWPPPLASQHGSSGSGRTVPSLATPGVEQQRSMAAATAAAATAAAAAGRKAAAGTAAATATASPAASGQAPGQHRYAPQDAAWRWVNATGRRLRVGLVNHAPYHLEIVAGLLHILGMMPVDVAWYQAPQVTRDGSMGAVELLEVTGFVRLLGYLPAMRPANDTASIQPCDFAVLVSPEYFPDQTRVFLAAAKPVTVLALAHNGMNGALKTIQALHPRMHFSALSPHVAAAARHALHIHTHWMLPTHPFVAKAPCRMDSADAMSCLDGFSVQGNFEAPRRNYTLLWRLVQQSQAAGSIPSPPHVRAFRLHLVGRGDVNTLKMPPDVRNVTTVHFSLKFPEYYEQLQHSHALLMLLGSVNYLTQKMSSTVVTSLMTGVPIVADQQVLASYAFLKPEHVFLIGPKETEMDVMQRVLCMSPAEVFAVHQKVAELAAKLNKRSALLLQAFMPLEEDAPLAPPVS